MHKIYTNIDTNTYTSHIHSGDTFALANKNKRNLIYIRVYRRMMKLNWYLMCTTIKITIIIFIHRWMSNHLHVERVPANGDIAAVCLQIHNLLYIQMLNSTFSILLLPLLCIPAICPTFFFCLFVVFVWREKSKQHHRYVFTNTILLV